MLLEPVPLAPAELEGVLVGLSVEVDGLVLMLPLVPLPVELCAKAVLPRANSAAETPAARSFIFIVGAPLVDPVGKDYGGTGSNGRAGAGLGPHIASRLPMKLFKPRSFDTWPAIAVGATIASLSILAGRLRPRRPGSQTNASAAMDDIELKPGASAEQVLDASVMGSFPASDPPSVQKAFQSAERNSPAQPASEPRATRSADWMLER